MASSKNSETRNTVNGVLTLFTETQDETLRDALRATRTETIHILLTENDSFLHSRQTDKIPNKTSPQEAETLRNPTYEPRSTKSRDKKAATRKEKKRRYARGDKGLGGAKEK